VEGCGQLKSPLVTANESGAWTDGTKRRHTTRLPVPGMPPPVSLGFQYDGRGGGGA